MYLVAGGDETARSAEILDLCEHKCPTVPEIPPLPFELENFRVPVFHSGDAPYFATALTKDWKSYLPTMNFAASVSNPNKTIKADNGSTTADNKILPFNEVYIEYHPLSNTWGALDSVWMLEMENVTRWAEDGLHSHLGKHEGIKNSFLMFMMRRMKIEQKSNSNNLIYDDSGESYMMRSRPPLSYQSYGTERNALTFYEDKIIDCAIEISPNMTFVAYQYNSTWTREQLFAISSANGDYIRHIPNPMEDFMPSAANGEFIFHMPVMQTVMTCGMATDTETGNQFVIVNGFQRNIDIVTRVFNVNDDLWMPGQPLPVFWGRSVQMRSTFVIVGGIADINGKYSYSRDIWEFDVSTLGWKERPEKLRDPRDIFVISPYPQGYFCDMEYGSDANIETDVPLSI